MDSAALPPVAAQRVAQAIKQAIAHHGRASVMLAGGGTPRAVYRELAQQQNLPWDRVEIFFGDERAVPPTDPESNYHMAREALLDAVPIPPAQIHRLPAERPDRDAAAAEYAALLPEHLDLLLLGIGEDGHTASLFPGSSALNQTAKVVAVMGPKPPPLRLTITPPVIAAAITKIVFASGSGKAPAVARALNGPGRPAECPAQLARDGVWILDFEAAGLCGDWDEVR